MPDPLRDQLQATLGASYTLERELGGGGMSRVFVADEPRLGRKVVVKVLAPALAAGVSAERFEREIKLAAALQEPHIVPVLTAGATADGLPFYTMPLVEGESLRARLARGPVLLGEAVRVLRDVAQALAYAHGRGIVHRDIKPENVLLSSGTAVVADFGIAKALQRARTVAPDGPAAPTQAGLTQLGTSLGTPAYMAPEQAAGDPATDHRADLYACGVMAYELLAGRHPFAGKSTPQALMAAHFGETPAPLPKGVPRPLAALVARCLAKDPAQRPASANELLAALDTAPVAPPDRRRRRALVGIAIGAVLAVGGVLAWRARAGAVAEGDAPPLVAVLPFETAQSGAGVVPDSTFADGLGDAITGKLARLQGLRVIDRASVRTLKDAAADPQRAGRALDADYVLRATLRWARGADGQPRVQVSPVLVRVADGTTRWAGEPSVVTPSDPFAVQGTLAAEVAEALDVALAPAERARLAAPATRDTAAFAAVERGRRLLGPLGSLGAPGDVLVRALREFEFAYRRDPRDAEAWALAADALQAVGQAADSTTMIDSAAVLARRALALDPGSKWAVNALAVHHLQRDQFAAARTVVARAVRAHPSSAELRLMIGLWEVQVGDPAVAWPSLAEAVRMAPRSEPVLRAAFDVALRLRRYADARELLARRRALAPTDAGPALGAALLAAISGDSVAVGRALRAYRAAGGLLYPGEQVTSVRSAFGLLRHADRGLGDELAAATPATYGARTAEDSLEFYESQASLHWMRGDSARARALAERGWAVARVVDPTMGWLGLRRAWFAAAQGDRTAAEASLAAFEARWEAAIRAAATSPHAVQLTCRRAEVEGLLGDATAMLPPLRRCLTMPNGYPGAFLATEPAFARHRTDPRVRALAAELADAEVRARSTPLTPAR